jgi:hypothetical protein
MPPPPVPALVTIPPFAALPASSQLSEQSELSPLFLRRGLHSGDTPLTAAARKERDQDRRSHRHRAFGAEEDISSTPLLSEYRRRLAGPPPSSSTPQLGIPALTPFGLDDEPDTPSPLSRRLSLGSTYRSRGSSRSPSGTRSSRNQGDTQTQRPISPQGREWLYCTLCRFPRPIELFDSVIPDERYGDVCKYCYNEEFMSVEHEDQLT